MLDRDGTLVVPPAAGRRYILSPDEVRLTPMAGETVRRLNRLGIAVAVVTNQRAVFRGLTTPAGVERVHERVAELLAEDGAHVDRWFVCPHDIGTCQCRKPLPGLLLRALAAFGVAAQDARMIGDAETDAQAGGACGVAAFGVGPGPGPGQPTAAVAWAGGLADAVERALAYP